MIVFVSLVMKMKHTANNSSGEAKGSRNSDMTEESQQGEAQLTDQKETLEAVKGRVQKRCATEKEGSSSPGK